MAGQTQPIGAVSVNNQFYQVGDEIWIDTGGATGYYHIISQADLDAALDLKVDKITGKGLSTEDYTTAEKNKLANQSGINTGDQDLSSYAPRNITSQKITIAGIRGLSGVLKTNYYSTTDAGQEGEWYYDAADTLSADNTGTILVTSDGKRIKRIFDQEVNLKWFGARGNEITDDTTAIEDALNFVASNVFGAVGGLGPVFELRGPSLYIPAGRYKYSGTGWSRVIGQTKNLRITGDGRDASVILITSNCYLLSYGDLNSLQIDDIAVVGGKGLIVQRATGNNVRRLFIIQRCEIANFTECAIGSNSDDMPNWKIRDNRFIAKIGDEGAIFPIIGIALSGLVDGCTIEDNEFLYCQYSVKLDRGGNNARIVGNFFPTPKVFDRRIGANIWIVPGANVVNSGPGLTIDDNKMGNEQGDAGDTNVTRILIADEDEASGTHFYNKRHATTISTKSFTGGQIINNLFTGFTGQSLGYVYSYTGNIGGLQYKGNTLVGTAPTYLFEFATGVTFSGNINYESNLIDIPLSHLLDSPGFHVQLSNLLGFAKVFDPLGVTAGSLDTAQIYNAQPADISYSIISNPSARSLTLSATTSVNITDVYGGDQAAELTFTTGGGQAYTSAFVNSRINQGEVIWIEIDVKKSAINPLDYLSIYLKRNDSLNYREQSRVITLNDKWNTIRFQAMVKNKNGDPIRIVITPFGYSAAVKTNVVVGQIKIYHANSPVNHSDLKILGANSGAWNGPKLYLGSSQLWIDSKGQIRINTITPTNETDGSVLIPIKGVTNIQKEFALTTKSFPSKTAEFLAYSLGLITGFPQVVIELTIYSNTNSTAYQSIKEVIITATNNSTSNRVSSQSLAPVSTKYTHASAIDFTVTTAIVSNLLNISITPASGTLNFLVKGIVTASYNNTSGYLVTEN